MDLATKIYRLTKKLPKEELYGLTNQLKRAAISIPSNIAEGNARFSPKDYLRFLVMARGSNAEVETQLLICIRLNYLEQADIEVALSLITEIGKMLNTIITKLKDQD